MQTFTYEEAIQYVKKTQFPAYGYIPKHKKQYGQQKKLWPVIGGEIFILEYDNFEEDEPGISISCVGGLFYSYEGEEDFFSEDNIPDYAKKIPFRKVIGITEIDTSYRIEILLKILAGYSEEENLYENTCISCDTHLFKFGYKKICTKCNNLIKLKQKSLEQSQ